MEEKDHTPSLDDQDVNTSLQQSLMEQHWQEARSFDRQKMWITGLFFAGLSYLLVGGYQEKALCAAVVIVGLAALMCVLKLQYLTELHMSKAEVYLAGNRRGRIFEMHIREIRYPGEQITPKAKGILRGFFYVSKLTNIYAWIILNGVILCLYFSLVGAQALSGFWLPSFWIIALVTLVLNWCAVSRFLGVLKAYAREKAKYNLAKQWDNLNFCETKSEDPPEKGEVMKGIWFVIGCLILAVGLVWSAYVNKDAQRYSFHPATLMKIDRVTGDTWLFTGSFWRASPDNSQKTTPPQSSGAAGLKDNPFKDLVKEKTQPKGND